MIKKTVPGKYNTPTRVGKHLVHVTIVTPYKSTKARCNLKGAARRPAPPYLCPLACLGFFLRGCPSFAARRFAAVESSGDGETRVCKMSTG